MTAALRPESPSDIPAIHALTAAAFLNAPHTDHTEQFIVGALRQAGALSISLVAEDAGQIVGHVAVSPVAISDGATSWYGLGPISVSPQCQSRGIGSLLMRAALKQLQAQGAAGCVVLGDPGYYQRFGFRPEARLMLPGVSPEYFQALAFGEALPRGDVAYHAAFSAQN